MTITQDDLSKMVKMAHLGNNKSIECKRIDDNRDIEISCTYCPEFCPKDDKYPYFIIKMREEELSGEYFFNTNEFPLIVDVFNKFISQGISESYLQDNMLPY